MILAVVALVVVSGWMIMPTPISTDLSQVGQGRPAMVLAYENFSPNGGEDLGHVPHPG